MWIRVEITKRRTHHRLVRALTASTGLVFALLWLLGALINNSICSDDLCFDNPDPLFVQLIQEKSEPVSELMTPDIEPQSVPQVEVVNEIPQAIDNSDTSAGVATDTADTLDDLSLPPDWYAIGEEAVSKSVADRFVREEIREYMWRRTGSVMFRDTGEFDYHEPPTIIADRKFRVPVGVLGIGINIGGCFIGIPLAGIPVEERGIGPNVIYCKDIYE